VTAAAKKSLNPDDALGELLEPYEEISIERRVQVPDSSCPTRRLTKIDSRLLAIARGELDPEDPFGGLIPIYDDELANDVEDGWLFIEETSSPTEEAMLSAAVPRVRMRANELLALPMSNRAGFFVSQVDGKRTLEELIEICELAELESLEIIDELLRMGAIELL
jgi:hypothetical protein